MHSFALRRLLTVRNLSILISLIALASLFRAPLPGTAYETGTHAQFNALGADLVKAKDPNQQYREVYLPQHVQQLRDGGVHEDEQYAMIVPTDCPDGRFMRHFYQPGSGLGLTAPGSGARCMDAVTWARSSASDSNSSDGDLTWRGAIDRYDYTPQSKEQAFFRVGHVAHLIGDMAQPDHIHVRAHPKQAYEPWAETNFSPGAGFVSGLNPQKRNRLEPHLVEMATMTYHASTFQGGPLAQNATVPINPASEFAQMFRVEWTSGIWHIDQWNLYNRTTVDPAGTHLGNWDGTLGTGLTNRDDEWYETIAETGGGLYGAGFYTLEGGQFVNAIPAVYKGAPNTAGSTLAQIYLNALAPRAVEYIGGMYQHFTEVVNHPPYVYKIKVTQGGRCVYEKHWENSVSDNRLTARELEDDCDTPEEERWINGEDGDVQIEIEFGNNLDDQIEKVKDVEVKIGSLTVNGSLDGEEKKWTGSFTPPDDHSLDGEKAIEIKAKDKDVHFTGRNYAGDELDADPASPAKAGADEPYNWTGYSTGPDKNHKVKIDTRKPKIDIRTETIGTECEPKYKVKAVIKDEGSGAGRSGLKRVTSSGGNFDPASDPQEVTLGTVGVGGTLNYSVEAEDKAGNKEEKEDTQEGPPEPPGCDHSDDNVSAASAQAPALDPPTSDTPRVAVLSNGYAPAASGFINALKEPNTLVDVDFSPTLVEEYPVLVIPSGGLYGLETSAFFRARLEEYVSRGGTLIVFDQPRGEEYTVLPGGGLNGYGWTQDNSCFQSSMYIDNYDQIVSGFDRALLTSNVDGYFTELPPDTQVLLNRAKNGQPAMVRYDYGQGIVIATTAYDDWGTSNWQTTADAKILNRDLLAWAVDPALLAEFDPNSAVSLPVPVANDSGVTAASVRLTLLAPGKTVASEITQAIDLAPGGTTDVTYQTTAVRPLGIWRVDYTLYDADGAEIQVRRPGERFVVKDPHPLTAPYKEVAFSVNAPTESFISGTDGNFTFTLFNNSDVDRTLTVRYGLPHHTWETGNAAVYGNFSDLSRTVTVPPHSQSQFVHTFPMRTFDRLFAYLYEGGVQKDATWFQTKRIAASATAAVRTNQAEYSQGQTVELAVDVRNLSSAAANFNLEVRVLAPNRQVVFDSTASVAVGPQATQTQNFSFVLPPGMPNGVFQVQADIRLGTARIGGGYGSFLLPETPARFAVTLPAALPGTAGDPLRVQVSNNHAYLTAAGSLSLVISGPGGSSLTPAAQPYSVGPGASADLVFDLSGLPLAFGAYRFDFTAADQYGTRTWTQTAQARVEVAATFDQRTYRVRETVGLAVAVNNTGDFGLSEPLQVAVPDAGFVEAQTVTLAAHSASSPLSFSVPLPAALSPGSHDVSLTLGGFAKTVSFLVPASQVTLSLAQSAFAAGDTIAVTLHNDGGVDAPTLYSLALTDSRGKVIASQADVSRVIEAGQSASDGLVIPLGAVSGPYQFVLQGVNQQNDAPLSLVSGVSITGIAATLRVWPDQDAYFTDEPVTAQSRIDIPAGLPGRLGDGSLNLRIYGGQVAGGQCGGPPTVLPSAQPLAVTANPWLYNDYIGVVANDELNYDESGRFTMGTELGDPNNPYDDYQRLLYGYPYPWSSYTTVRVDGVDTIFGTGAGVFTVPPQFSPDGSQIVATWQYGDVAITQYLTLVNSPSGNPDALRIEYAAENLGSVPHDVGWRIMMDTQLGNNDGAPFRLPDGTEITTETDFVGDDVPRTWLTVDDLVFPQIAARGIFGTGGAPVPDRWVFANWSNIYSTVWNFVANPAYPVTGDSGVAGYWNPTTLAPGATRSIGMNYGVAPITGTGGDLSTAVSAPGTLASPADNPFTVEAFVQNNTFSVAHNAQTTIQLPIGLILEPGYTASQALGDLDPGEVAQVTWLVRATGAVVGTLHYEVVTTSDDVSGSTVGLDICIPEFISQRDAYGFLVWETTLPVTDPASGQLDLSTLAGLMPGPGTYFLVGRLQSDTGQLVVLDDQRFYVLDRDTQLTLRTDQRIYRPGETIQASGWVTNGSSLTSNLVLQVTDGTDLLIDQPLTLAPGEDYAYATSFAAPAADVTLTATAGGVSSVVPLRVTSPALTAVLEVPAVAGSAPFDAVVIVTNEGDIPAAVEVAIDGAPAQTRTLEPGTQARVVRALSITADTTVTAEVTGDLVESLSSPVTFGEAAAVHFHPEATYVVGPVGVPYVLENTGLLPVSFDVALTVRNAGGSVVMQTTLPAELAVGATQASTLALGDLAAGAYTLEAQSPFGLVSESFVVMPAYEATLSASAGSAADNTVPVDVTVTNTGLLALDGRVDLSTSFFVASAPVTALAPGQSIDLVIAVDVDGAAAGSHPATLTLRGPDGGDLANASITLNVPAADLVLTALPDNLTLPVGANTTLRFAVANQGTAAGEARLTLSFSDVAEEEQVIWLAGGQSGFVDFTFYVPPELEAKTYEAFYTFNGEPGSLLLNVEGVDIDVAAALDRSGYREGETAHLTLHITELANRMPPPLYARVRFNEFDSIQPFSLNAQGTADLSFDVPVAFDGDQKVFYGIYDVAAERSIHLNTLYLPRLHDEVTVLTDKQVYLPGETVVATVLSDITGQLAVTAPGFSGNVALTGGNTSFSFVLPAPMARGTYFIDYAAQGCGCASEGQARRAPFDVDAVEVRITDARLDKSAYLPGETVHLDLTVASDQPLTVNLMTWIRRPDRSLVAGPVQTVNLLAMPNNALSAALVLDTDQAGLHRVVYRLVDPVDPQLVCAQGADGFDVGSAILVDVQTDKTDYRASDEPVLVTLMTFAPEAGSGQLRLAVDGSVVYDAPVAVAAGFHELTVPLPGGYGFGRHILHGTLTQGGFHSQRDTGFRYAVAGVDLVAPPPRLGTLVGTQAAVTVVVANRGAEPAGASQARLYDGDPSAGGILVSTVDVPVLAGGTSHAASVAWDVAGRAGTRQLVVVADAASAVAETNETNNQSQATVEVGALAHDLSIDKATYDRSEAVIITSDLVNLAGTTLGDLTLETTVFRLNGTQRVATLWTESLPMADLAPGAVRPESTAWQIAPDVAEFQADFEVQQRVLAGSTVLSNRTTPGQVVPVRVTIDLPDGFGHEGWYTTIPEINLESSRPADLFYRWDDGPALPYAGTFDGLEGPHRLYAFAQRNGIVVGPETQSRVPVDTRPPVTQAAVDPPAPDGQNGWYVGQVVISLSATDEGMGVLDSEVSTDGATWNNYAGPITVAGDGEAVVSYRSTDLALNVETPGALALKRDATPPEPHHGGPFQVDEGNTVQLDARASVDVTSGLQQTAWDIDGDGFDDGDPATFGRPEGPDVATVALQLIDNAGNVLVTETTVTVNNVAPSVEAGPDQIVATNTPLSLAPATFSDAGVLDTHTAIVHWGDGLDEPGVVAEQNGAGTVAATHAYAESGVYSLVVEVCDDDGGCGTDYLTVTVRSGPPPGQCELYPIALNSGSLANIVPGQVVENIFNGQGPGQFGWLTWTGEQGVPSLVESLTPPGTSHLYVNPNNPADHSVSIGDWVGGRPGVANSAGVRAALDNLMTQDIIVPVWDAATGSGSNARYRVANYAVVRLLDYRLPANNRITVRFLGYQACNN